MVINRKRASRQSRVGLPENRSRIPLRSLCSYVRFGFWVKSKRLSTRRCEPRNYATANVFMQHPKKARLSWITRTRPRPPQEHSWQVPGGEVVVKFAILAVFNAKRVPRASARSPFAIRYSPLEVAIKPTPNPNSFLTLSPLHCNDWNSCFFARNPGKEA